MTNVAPLPPPPRGKTLGKLGIVSGRRLDMPLRMFIYGPGGAGKTTFAASAPDPIFLCVEEGSGQFDVRRVNFEPDGATERTQPRDWNEIVSAVESIATEDTGARTFVLDGMDQADVLCQEHVLRGSKWGTIQEYSGGYGRGESSALQVWRALFRRIEEIWTRRRMNIVLLGHSKVKRFNNPEGPEFERYQPSLTDHPQGNVAGFVLGWSDITGFARYETLTAEQGKGRIIGIGDDKRLLHLHRAAAWDAKCRPFGVPSTLALPYDRPFDTLMAAIKDGRSPTRLREEIVGLLGAAPEDVRRKVEAWLPTAGDDVSALSSAVEKLRKVVGQQSEEGAGA